MRKRGFSLLEVVVVVSAIAIGGSLALSAMSDQVLTARARSDELGLLMRLKAERNNARERLRPLGISRDEVGDMRFHSATVTTDVAGRSCTLGSVVRSAHFDGAHLIDTTPPSAA